MQAGIKNKKIAFLCPYPFDTAAPSQRFRFEQYLSYLKEHGFEYKIFPFLDHTTNAIIFKKGFFLQKAFGVFKGFFLRWLHLAEIVTYDYIFLHREATPLGPPLIEWFIVKVFRKKIIFDFDDAIWKTQDGGALVNWIKNPGKVNLLIKWSYKVSCGNEYLGNHARAFNSKVVYNPTTIDTQHFYNKIKDQHCEKVSIGWSGSHSTLIYLYPIVPIIEKLQEKYNFNFVVICNKEPDFTLKSLVFVPWDKESEIEDLLKLNIGVMPLPEVEWTLGKCGLKALQYMALGIPALVSPVGVNADIVTNDKDGFLCKDEDEWIARLSFMIENEESRIAMGKNAREMVQNKYSVHSNKTNFINLFS